MQERKTYNLFAAFALALTVLCADSYAQPVHIPDPNLRAAISEALDGAPLTRDTMLQLTKLDAPGKGIIDLTGLEYAHNLTFLGIPYNPITDLTPITGLTKLTTIYMWRTGVSDLTPLANLKQLRFLHAPYCGEIVDISPLANLPQLEEIDLTSNKIVDVSPLAGLTELRVLEIEKNRILDHSPLDGLSLEHFTYDQTCDMPPLPLEPRLERSFPSIFRAFGASILNQPHLPDLERRSQHDLSFCCLMFGGTFVETENGVVILSYMEEAIQRRDDLIAQNPNRISLAAFRWLLVDLNTYPPDSPYWIRDANGDIAMAHNSGTVDITHPDMQREIIQKAVAIDKCGLYDGVFFDFWGEYAQSPANVEAMVEIVKGIREVTRENFLIMGNSNQATAPKTGSYLNGLFMETRTPDWRYKQGGNESVEAHLMQIETTLRWGAENLRSPQIIGLEGEGFTDNGEPLDSPRNLRWMRAFTTLSLTFSDGYVLYIRRFLDGVHQHWHYWYDFWDADLGRPIGEKFTLYNDEIPGLYIREYTNGWAVYNHSGASQVITLPEEAQGVASGIIATEHALADIDGEMYLRVKPKNPADVNRDGVVNILDLVAVASNLSQTGENDADVNKDGVVNILDLVQVAGALGGDGAAPSASSLDLSIISAADVAAWLAQAQSLGAVDANFQRGIRFLEQLLAALTPKETSLLPNYPNPFNPETWIPYRLERAAEVTITIYDTQGAQVRRLALGNQAAGYYAARGKAAYWDGRNERGEAVASGIYFYQFRAGDYAASRRMVILK